MGTTGLDVDGMGTKQAAALIRRLLDRIEQIDATLRAELKPGKGKKG